MHEPDRGRGHQPGNRPAFPFMDELRLHGHSRQSCRSVPSRPSGAISANLLRHNKADAPAHILADHTAIAGQYREQNRGVRPWMLKDDIGRVGEALRQQPLPIETASPVLFISHQIREWPSLARGKAARRQDQILSMFRRKAGCSKDRLRSAPPIWGTRRPRSANSSAVLSGAIRIPFLARTR